MTDRNDDVVARGRDASSKLPSAQSLKNSSTDTPPAQRSGSWSWPKLGSKGHNSTSPTASVDQDVTPADQLPVDAGMLL